MVILREDKGLVMNAETQVNKSDKEGFLSVGILEVYKALSYCLIGEISKKSSWIIYLFYCILQYFCFCKGGWYIVGANKIPGGWMCKLENIEALERK